MKQRVEATVYGHVQGVSFRYYTMREAGRLQLTGWVANKRDGTVRVIAEGPREPLQSLLNFLQQGPPMARVDAVDSNWREATNEFSNFNVRHL